MSDRNTHAASGGTGPSLDSAVQSAIALSLAAAAGLQTQVDAALRMVSATVTQAAVAPTTGDEPEVMRSLQSKLEAARAEASDLFTRQREALSTVNLVMFGRTGAGKSSLIEALSHGDGVTISTGESDFTTEVRPVAWNGVRFMDTPGIGGWGRTCSRDELEARTRKAAEVADIVVLCFDSQNQQASEFEKIAAWVKEFGKPVIVVLNVRASKWRWCESVPLCSQRQRLSGTVREHVSNIETELANISIHNASVVAIGAQRAVYARAGDPFRGPQAEQCGKLREMLGRDELLRQSNLEVFEAIIVEALANHAVEIRLGMLHSQARALLERLTRDLQEACDESAMAAEVLARAITSIFEIIGYPAEGSATRETLPKTASGESLLAVTEQARGGAYTASAEGKVQRFAHQRLKAELGVLRSNSLRSADNEIANCFNKGCDLDGEEFNRRVYDPAQIEAAGKKVVVESAELLRRELNLTLADARMDVEFAANEAAETAGATGAVRRKVGYAAKIGGILAGAAATLAPVVLLDPEPISKATLAVTMVALGILSAVLNWFGGKQARQAEQERQHAKSSALANVRRHVNDAYDRMEQQAADRVNAMVLAAGLATLFKPLENAGALWTFTTAAKQALHDLEQLREVLPLAANAQQLLHESARRIAGARSGLPGASGMSRVLLGEDWLNDDTGIDAASGSAEPKRTRAYDAGLFARLFAGFQRFAERFGGGVRRGDGVSWLADAEGQLATDAFATAPMAELRQLAAAGLPRYHLFGDYSSGKTSFIKRLLIDSGLSLRATLEVRADPTTDGPHTYEWENALLVDSPGLQSTKEAHAAAALRAVSDASALICLLQPNLLVGSTEALELVLKGDPASGLAPKLDRTLFIIHRADELGADPDVVPEQYAQLCQRKKIELRQALASRGISVDEDRILCMAADPHGMVGDRRDVNATQFDHFRAWDGFDEFHRAMHVINRQSAGLDYTLLEGGLARLGRVDAAAAKEAATLKQRAGVFRRQHTMLTEITEEGQRLCDELQATARRIVEDHSGNLRDRVTASANQVEIEAVAKQLSAWWTQPEFVVEAERWQTEAHAKINLWWQRGTDQLERSLNAPRFRATLAGASCNLDVSGFEPPPPNWFKRTLDAVAQPLKGATRDMVYAAGKALGGKFRPYGAVNLAKTLGRVGAALGVVVTALDIIELYNSFGAEKKRQGDRAKLDAFIRDTTEQVLVSITLGDEEATGPLGCLSALTNELASIGRELGLERDTINIQNETLHARRQRYHHCIAAAWKALGQTPPTP